MFAVGFIVWVTLNSALNPFRHRPPKDPPEDWLSEVEIFSTYADASENDGHKSHSSQRTTDHMECVASP